MGCCKNVVHLRGWVWLLLHLLIVTTVAGYEGNVQQLKAIQRANPTSLLQVLVLVQDCQEIYKSDFPTIQTINFEELVATGNLFSETVLQKVGFELDIQVRYFTGEKDGDGEIILRTEPYNSEQCKDKNKAKPFDFAEVASRSVTFFEGEKREGAIESKAVIWVTLSQSSRIPEGDGEIGKMQNRMNEQIIRAMMLFKENDIESYTLVTHGDFYAKTQSSWNINSERQGEYHVLLVPDEETPLNLAKNLLPTLIGALDSFVSSKLKVIISTDPDSCLTSNTPCLLQIQSAHAEYVAVPPLVKCITLFNMTGVSINFEIKANNGYETLEFADCETVQCSGTANKMADCGQMAYPTAEGKGHYGIAYDSMKANEFDNNRFFERGQKDSRPNGSASHLYVLFEPQDLTGIKLEAILGNGQDPQAAPFTNAAPALNWYQYEPLDIRFVAPVDWLKTLPSYRPSFEFCPQIGACITPNSSQITQDKDGAILIKQFALNKTGNYKIKVKLVSEAYPDRPQYPFAEIPLKVNGVDIVINCEPRVKEVDSDDKITPTTLMMLDQPAYAIFFKSNDDDLIPAVEEAIKPLFRITVEGTKGGTPLLPKVNDLTSESGTLFYFGGSLAEATEYSLTLTLSLQASPESNISITPCIYRRLSADIVGSNSLKISKVDDTGFEVTIIADSDLAHWMANFPGHHLTAVWRIQPVSSKCSGQQATAGGELTWTGKVFTSRGIPANQSGILCIDVSVDNNSPIIAVKDTIWPLDE